MSLSTWDSMRVSRAVKNAGVYTGALRLPHRELYTVHDVTSEVARYLLNQRHHLAGVCENNTLSIEVAGRDYHYGSGEVVPDFFISLTLNGRHVRLIGVVCMPIDPREEYHVEPRLWQETCGGYSMRYGTRATIFTNYYNWLFLETNILGGSTGRTLVHRNEATLRGRKDISVGYQLAKLVWKAWRSGDVRLDEVRNY